ncbi:MAG: fumarate reductase subunit C [Nitrospirae bacterium]|nr:fumarate reductase subunit C [Nitrospirota bacterium]
MKVQTNPISEPTRTYRRPIPCTWWMKKGSYFIFMMRELSSVFVALYSIFLIIQFCAISEGPEKYNAVLSVFQSWWMILIHVVIGAFVLLHMVTWFRISGRIFGARPLTPGMVTVANYIVWAVVSIVILYFLALY